VATHAYLDHDGPIPFAHRGGAEEFPENTMHAFESAVRLGYRYLETDVHATADGVLISFHDEELDRVTDGKGRIADLPWSTVQRARIAGAEPIPTFEELVAAFPDVRFNVDVKLDNAVEPFVEAVRRTGIIDRICVGGFSDRRTARVKAELGPALCTSLGPKAIGALRAASYGAPYVGAMARKAGQCAQVPTNRGPVPLVDPKFVRTAHRLGMQVHVWTIDDPAEMDRLLDLGVDGIMTDKPSVLKAVLQRRGVWR
jgi:glycerophosphoryl diester phosphodiesterase